MTSFTDIASLLLAILLSSVNKKTLVILGVKPLNENTQKSHQKFAKLEKSDILIPSSTRQ